MEKLSTEYVQKYLLEKEFILKSKYIDSRTRVVFEDFDGYIYHLSIDALRTTYKTGNRPFRFGKKNSFTVENIRLWLFKNVPTLSMLSNSYSHARDANLIIACFLCEKIWVVSWNTLKKSKKCPNCTISLGESVVEKFLQENNIYYEYQKKFDDCRNILPLPFDFYIPNKNIVIEYQGEQHYKAVDFRGMGKEFAKMEFEKLKKRDAIKKDYCKKNNINLLEIPFFELKSINDILKKNLIL